MRKFRKNQRGFTMIELLVVVVIVGILAAIAVPIYGKYIKNSRLSESHGRVGEIVTAAKAWAQEHQDTSGNPVWPDAAAAAAGGIISLTSTENFTYAITSASADATSNPFTVQATGINRMTGVTITYTIPDIGSAGNPPIITGM